MPTIKTPIIPTKPTFAKVQGPHELHKEAICVFAATGFFLDTDTYFKDCMVLPPASNCKVDDDGYFVESKPRFQWHYSPRDISFETALEEFTVLFEQIITDQHSGSKVILPLSGGLDSRTQAVALAKLNKTVMAYSYSFKGGFSESTIGAQIATECGFNFQEYTIEPGYLWTKIEELAAINKCYSDFTHPRQMAMLDEFKKMEGSFSLGHWGDVLFDRGAPEGTTQEQLLDLIIKKIIKKGGLELATALWQEWGLEGDFTNYLQDRVASLLDTIKIENPSGKLRAFKSMYWAPRWTSVNLAVFEVAHPVHLPYYDDKMCAFVCTVPEAYLADRKLQIAYIKQQNPALAKITWQDHKPYNLFTFEQNKAPNNLPYRMGDKLKRMLKAKMGKPYIQRNWELQFLGMENDEKLQAWLFSENLHPFLSKPLLARFYNSFKAVDAVTYAHPLSMLLTLSLKMKKNK